MDPKSGVFRFLLGIIGLFSIIFETSGISILYQEGVAPGLTPVAFNVGGLKNTKIDLGGTWKFKELQQNIGSIKNIPASWTDIKVPGEWIMQGFNVKPNTRAACIRSVIIPSEWGNCTIILRCDAVYSDANVWVNGKYRGNHQGGMNAFEMDITKLLKPGLENIIALDIMNESLADSLMSGTQYAAHPLGGILRKIYLIAVPKIHLSSLHVNTDWESNSDKARLKVEFEIANQSELQINNLKPDFELFDSSGKRVEMEVASVDQKKAPNSVSFNVKNPVKWDPEHPNLYNLQITLNAGGQQEQIRQRFGFRMIQVIGNQLFINEKPVKLRGVNHHDAHPLLGRALNLSLWEKDVRLYRAANVNYIRTSHYPPSEEFVDLCDELGMYVEVENPIAWVGHGANSKWEREDPHQLRFLPLIRQITSQTVEYLRNHPSVIMWSMANESAWGPNWKENHQFLKALDPSRPSTFHDQAYGNYNNFGSYEMPVANYHYPGPVGPEIAKDFPRPLLFGEYVHLNTYNRQEIVTDPGVRDAWGIGMEPMYNNMYSSRGCLGGAIWSGIDDVFYLPSGKAVGYGEWGPVDGWRREKPEYYHIKKSYSPVKVFTNQINIPIQGNEILLQVENRFDFTNFNELKINWEIGKDSGTVSPDVQPRSYGVIHLNTGHNLQNGDSLTLKFTSPLGFVTDEYLIPVGLSVNKTPAVLGADEKTGFTKSTEEITIAGKSFSWIFDAQKGTIKKAIKSGKVVLLEGSSLMMLPLSTGPCLTEHSLAIQPLNYTCTSWKMTGLATEETKDSVVVRVQGSYNEAEGSVIYNFGSKGNLLIRYNFQASADINPRQWGLVFTTPRNIEKLSWNRKGQWNKYPPNHIGRNQGVAIPFPKHSNQENKYGTEPLNDWKDDSNEMGSNDFRSSKDFINEASLESDEGYGVRIFGDGKQTFRAFVNGSVIQFLVAGFSTGGGDMFFSSHLQKYRKPLKKGDNFSGTVTLDLFSK